MRKDPATGTTTAGEAALDSVGVDDAEVLVAEGDAVHQGKIQC